MSSKYTFTSNQLFKLLGETIELYQEYKYVHDKDSKIAKGAAVLDTLDGLEAERDLVHEGECEFSMQVDPRTVNITHDIRR